MKTTTKLFFRFIICLIIYSCSSDDDNGEVIEEGQSEYDYFIRFEVDGSKQEFLVNMEKNRLPAIVYATLNMSDEEIKEEDLYISYITTQNYEDSFIFNLWTSDPVESEITYTQNNTVQMHITSRANGRLISTSSVMDFNEDIDMKIQFSEITETEMKGTFSGSIEDENGLAEFTDGEFYLPILSSEHPLPYSY